MKLIVAVDPGASGGIAWQKGEELGSCPMPGAITDAVDLLRSLRAGSDLCEIWIEDVPKFVGKAIPSSSTAVLFRNFGYIEGAATAFGYRVILVKPQDWQSHFRLGTKRDCASTTEWKNKLKAESARRFPTQWVTLKTADALLILDFARK
jgi:hypothetical protein